MNPRIWVGVSAVLLTPTGGAAPPAHRDPLVLVERIVDSRYGETPQATADLNRGLRSSLRYAYKVNAGESLQKITGSLFGINPGQSGYAKLESTIKQWNGLQDANRIAAGQTLVVPDLPRKEPQVVNNAGPSDQIPKIKLGPLRSDVLSGHAYNYALGATLVHSDIADLGQKSAPLVRQMVWLPASRAREDPNVKIVAQPIAIQFHAAGTGAADDISHDTTALQQFSNSHHALHESVVYVLDDSWPDAKSFADSVQFLRQADTVIRNKFHLGNSTWPTSLSPPQANTNFPWVGSGTTSHATKIQSSLQPFLPISSSVKVIYVPLFKQQTGAVDLLGEIILVSLIAHYKQDHLADPMPDGALQAITSKAISERNQIVDSLPAYISDQPADTDQAVVTGMLTFAQLYAQATGQPFFLNASWVVNRYEFDFGPPPNLMGVTLAAVGDNPSTDIFKAHVLLASRAKSSPGDVIAIMNNHQDGSRGGCTSYWTPTAPPPVYGLTYDGFIASNSCGTSFSAPRIAWVLAFRETLHPLVTDAQEQEFWFGKYRNFILSIQDTTQTSDLKYWFSPLLVVQKP